MNGRADHKQDVCQFLEVVGLHGRSNQPKIEPKTRHAPLLEPQALEDDRHCSLDLQLQITRSNKTWSHVTFVYCVSAFTLAKASFCLTWDVHYLASITLQDSPHQKIQEKSSTHRDSKHTLLNVWCIDRFQGTS